MQRNLYFDQFIESEEYRFDKLVIQGVDNEPVKKFHKSDMNEVEYCLFHKDIVSGDEYFNILGEFVDKGVNKRQAAPIVRFADGEYAFYANSLKCNGLYQQAESVDAIKNAMPSHIEALRYLHQNGKLAPVIFPGNVRPKKKTLFSFFRKSESDDSAVCFLEFLHDRNILLEPYNYIPFFVVYAYLTSAIFSRVVDGKKVCVISSECNDDLCRQWFAKFSSYPEIAFVKIPDRYVATQWDAVKMNVLSQLPGDTDLCLVGAGIGSLLVCVDVAREFSIPAIDAGHVMNMLNGREDKSNGPRLYTLHKDNK